MGKSATQNPNSRIIKIIVEIMYKSSAFLQTGRLGVGLIGTGYVGKLRAEAFKSDTRVNLVGVAGRTPEKVAAFAENYQTQAVSSWQELIEREDVDLVVVCSANHERNAIANAAIDAGKHLVIEYPLALNYNEAEAIIARARANNLFLHVEHIELLGGVHQTIKQNLEQVGEVFYVRYNTIKPENPAPRKWTYNHEYFGFPLIGALSRLHRLTDLFGEVFTVNCHQRFWQVEEDYYQACFCIAQLSFQSGLLGQIIYAKGETLWQAERKFEVHGEKGGLIFHEDGGYLVHTGETIPIAVGDRRGLFAKDTNMVIEHLFNGTPLYITPEESLYTLKVATAAQRSAETGLTIVV